MKKYDKISFISINEYYDNWKINTYVTLLLIFTLFLRICNVGNNVNDKIILFKNKSAHTKHL